jgi:hypothetical protein
MQMKLKVHPLNEHVQEEQNKYLSFLLCFCCLALFVLIFHVFLFVLSFCTFFMCVLSFSTTSVSCVFFYRYTRPSLKFDILINNNNGSLVYEWVTPRTAMNLQQLAVCQARAKFGFACWKSEFVSSNCARKPLDRVNNRKKIAHCYEKRNGLRTSTYHLIKSRINNPSPFKVFLTIGLNPPMITHRDDGWGGRGGRRG